jgi:hypothetical protein
VDRSTKLLSWLVPPSSACLLARFGRIPESRIKVSPAYCPNQSSASCPKSGDAIALLRSAYADVHSAVTNADVKIAR